MKINKAIQILEDSLLKLNYKKEQHTKKLSDIRVDIRTVKKTIKILNSQRSNRKALLSVLVKDKQ